MLAMNPTEIDQHLNDSTIGRLCMADLSGRPYTVPIPFLWHRGCLYLRLPLSGRKGEILQQNRQVCFESDCFTPNLDDYASVLVEGLLETVQDLAEKERVRQLNEEKYLKLRNGYRPGHGRTTPLDQLPMQRIRVVAISGRKKT